MNAAERQQVGLALLDAFGEDYDQMGRVVHALMERLPDEDWPALLTALASAYPPFQASGLSIDWWVSTVIERATSMS